MANLLFGLCYILFGLLLVHNVLAAWMFRVLKKQVSGVGGATSPPCDVLPATFMELMAFAWTAKARTIDADNLAAMVVWMRVIQVSSAITFGVLLVSAYLGLGG